ncbi:TRAP transporter small permease [Paenibacillus chungangensis]|uniref:TRAP transporter small permease n=1 Tax=Paenibacillus chungangensis TaxID=696535 RepID=A0ABW3HQV0_9BACL
MNKAHIARVVMKADHVLFKTVQVITVLLLAGIVLTISASVFTRWIIFYPLNFADALAKYMLMWMAFLGMGLALRSGEHIAVDMLVTKLKGAARKFVQGCIHVLLSVFLLIIAYYGFQYAMDGRDSYDPFVFGISMMIPYLSVSVGAIYACIQINLRMIGQMLGGDL